MRAYHKAVAAYLGKRMKEKRDNLGYTQEKMAEILEVTARMYGNYERGKSACYVDVFSYLRRCFPQRNGLRSTTGFVKASSARKKRGQGHWKEETAKTQQNCNLYLV